MKKKNSKNIAKPFPNKFAHKTKNIPFWYKPLSRFPIFQLPSSPPTFGKKN